MMRLWMAMLVTAAAPAWVFAAEAEGHGGGSANPFAGDLGNALWTLIIFVLVLVVLGKFAWGPILQALQKREDFIHESLREAQQARDDAQTMRAELEATIKTAQAEATAIVDEGRRDAEVLRRKLEAQAKTEADALMERARREIALATDAAVKELYTLSATLATEVAGRVIAKELNPADHERLISESIEEITRLSRN